MAVTIGAAWAFLYILQPSTHTGILTIDILKSLCLPAQPAWTVEQFAAMVAMWAAMSLAMMLPTAAPMLSVFMDITEEARAKDIPAVSPFVLLAGYITVWFAFSVIAAVLQLGLAINNELSQSDRIVSSMMAGTVLLLAGAYQFSQLKYACLTKCGRPMPFLLANWTDRPLRVFKMGLTQGLYCLGCCWALMLVMFVAGLMNLAWMAIIGLVMMLEKTLSDASLISRAVGVMLVAASGAYFAEAFGWVSLGV